MPGYSRWITRKYTVEFLTPAFLGGADQSGQWRTPPFKALLRQWWRVAYAAERGFAVDLTEMRKKEGRLLGNAWLTDAEGESAASRSLVRLRLETWKPGNLSSWQRLESRSVSHPEVNQPVGPHLYLGYGPLTYDRQARGTALKARSAIHEGEKATFQLAFPEQYGEQIETALRLIDLYGAVGGRSRNGWGSFRLIPDGDKFADIKAPMRNWKEALNLDWAHCIGKDGAGPLVWRTKREYTDWKELMRDLAVLKIAFRTLFRFSSDTTPHASPEDRHWLAYPVTNHGVQVWGNQARLPNSLRFKIRCLDSDPKKIFGVIFHMPCSPPAAFRPQPDPLRHVWQQVHELLDELRKEHGQRQLPANLNSRVAQELRTIQLQRVKE